MTIYIYLSANAIHCKWHVETEEGGEEEDVAIKERERLGAL